MIKKHRSIAIRLASLLALGFLLGSAAFAQPTAKITLKVVDETGEPVAGAKVGAGFHTPRKSGEGWGDRSHAVNDLTSDDGTATLSGETLGYISYGAAKDGYYQSGNEYRFKDADGLLLKRWQPWNPTIEVVLKKKVNPTSLYVRNMQIDLLGRYIRIPGQEKPYGFDLEVGDWVAPHGKGVRKDFIFEFGGTINGPREFDITLKLAFDNPDDGILVVSVPARFGSELRLPLEAPLSGYQPMLEQRYARTVDQFIQRDFPEDRNYFFRVRSKRDGEGKLISALYGKIHGNISFDEKGDIGFFYYLNPRSKERGLEFDLKKNLATGKRTEGSMRP